MVVGLPERQALQRMWVRPPHPLRKAEEAPHSQQSAQGTLAKLPRFAQGLCSSAATRWHSPEAPEVTPSAGELTPCAGALTPSD
eukprot:62712-Prorocentrum_minimum.AAC.1